MTACSPTKHDFEKFDDATIFCRKCGEQRVMDVSIPCYLPHFPTYPYYPTYPWWGTFSGTISKGLVIGDTTSYDLDTSSSFTNIEGGS